MFLDTALLTAMTAAALLVPPGELVRDHTQPYHYAQPELHRFERRLEDEDRRVAWELFAAEMEEHWADYRDAGSTRSAYQRYLRAAHDARRRYVYGDLYLAPVIEW